MEEVGNSVGDHMLGLQEGPCSVTVLVFGATKWMMLENTFASAAGDLLPLKSKRVSLGIRRLLLSNSKKMPLALLVES